jgi:hypothetical protein
VDLRATVEGAEIEIEVQLDNRTSNLAKDRLNLSAVKRMDARLGLHLSKQSYDGWISDYLVRAFLVSISTEIGKVE